VAAQLVGGQLRVLPQDGHDQVLGADIGGAGLGGDALGLVEHEPQRPDDPGLGTRVGRLPGRMGGHQGVGDPAGLLGGQAAGPQQGRPAGLLVVPAP
jgi:hypothetical protein